MNSAWKWEWLFGDWDEEYWSNSTAATDVTLTLEDLTSAIEDLCSVRSSPHWVAICRPGYWRKG